MKSIRALAKSAIDTSQKSRPYYSNATQGTTFVDLRSDTVTTPDEEMRSAMASAVVGDDVLKEDPTVNELERRSSELLGKEAALFVTSGSMGNFLAVMSHCWERGSELIVGTKQHIHWWEQGSAAQFGGISVNNVPNNADGTMEMEDIRAALRDPSDSHHPISRLICLENTHNGCGGRILPPAFSKEIGAFARSLGLSVHVDGARLMNASVASGTPPSQLLQDAHSVSLCLSKGLGAPVGSVIAGTEEFIWRASRLRKGIGGGWRQAGILAAAGILALERAEATLSEDHRRAQLLSQGVAALSDNRVRVVEPVETNIVLLDTLPESQTIADKLMEGPDAVACFPYGPHRLRWVTHHGLSDQDIQTALRKLAAVLSGLP